ncbi:hypothetical protein VTL71DRAFT_4150 [Oculimacula yallundae]|uniref:Dihydroneopterin aldolase/epimerase domain-containing protein n=1 Tax=Oculimacula yallundae TaxID=86028 RepID=A0ABR4C4Z5_9HELO
MPLLVTPHALSALTGDPHTSISVTNLQTTLPLTDAWGRSNILQPVLISIHISLLHPFTTASSSDTVSGSTVHYGTLSKAILEACEKLKGMGKSESVRTLIECLGLHLTGVHMLSSRNRAVKAFEELKEARERGSDGALIEPLKGVGIHLLELEVTLPKASLMGSGTSLKGSFGFEIEKREPSAYSMVLRIKELRIPTLVGVNPNERLAKQIVVVDVELLRWWDVMGNRHCHLEQVVVKSTEESSFQTLEALALHLIERIIRHIIIPSYVYEKDALTGGWAYTYPAPASPEQTMTYPLVKISLSKPTAVTFADAPTVSMVVDTDSQKSEVARRIWDTAAMEGKFGLLPFPLQGRLDKWLEMNA